jgi:formylglycine-generating enzyme required for sulfatase activity
MQSNEDCCASLPVAGGSFNRDNNVGFPATITSLRLDRFEVTVGRFRKFVEKYDGATSSRPAVGAGLHPRIAGSGWNGAWDGSLPASAAALKAALGAVSPALWSDVPGAYEAFPINGLTWYEAFAFCAWDGGFLPTEAEWNYAAAGGSEQRYYPWGSTSIDSSYANYSCGAPCAGAPVLVGKTPAGDGLYGHADLAGNTIEWVLDWYAATYTIAQCNDCADLTPATYRSFRGGSFANIDADVVTFNHTGGVPTDRYNSVSVRCARE